MRQLNNEKLIREYVRSILTEEDAGNPYLGSHGASGYDASGPYGVSFGSADDLKNTFITPFVDVFKTALGKTKEITRRAGTVLWVTLQTVLTTIIPVYGYNYSDVFDKEKEDLKKIRDQYKDVYERTDKALASSDAGMLAFMASPALFMSYKFGKTAGPAAAKEAKELLSAITVGYSDKLLGKVKSAYEASGRWVVGDAGSSSKSSKKKEPKDVFPEGRLYEEAEEKKKMMSLEKVLSNKKFLARALESPEAQRMQKQAEELYKRTLSEVYEQAETLLKKINTIEDLEKQGKGKIKGDMKKKFDEIKALPPEEKKKAEEMLIDGVRKAMKEFYVKNLTDHVEKVMAAGIPAEAPYVKDYKSVISKISSL